MRLSGLVHIGSVLCRWRARWILQMNEYEVGVDVAQHPRLGTAVMRPMAGTLRSAGQSADLTTLESSASQHCTLRVQGQADRSMQETSTSAGSRQQLRSSEEGLSRAVPTQLVRHLHTDSRQATWVCSGSWGTCWSGSGTALGDWGRVMDVTIHFEDMPHCQASVDRRYFLSFFVLPLSCPLFLVSSSRPVPVTGIGLS